MLTLTIKKVCARDEKPKKLVRGLILYDVLGLVVSDLVIKNQPESFLNKSAGSRDQCLCEGCESLA